jgi:predicted RNase H-like nuclease
LRSDEELVRWLRPLVEDDVLVAIDAPLVVRNATGRRRCEQLVSRCFGAHHAGAHSANLGIAAFRGGVRGERIARELGLDVDPAFPPAQPVRRAIEVYPHPAIVALFGLPLTLKYKAKPGRTLESRSVALTELARRLAALRDADPPLDVGSAPRWELLCRIAEHPASGAALARVEDELDAYVCAYVAAYYWTHGTTRCRVVGDLESGYIVTPVSERQARCLDEGLGAAFVAAQPVPGTGFAARGARPREQGFSGPSVERCQVRVPGTGFRDRRTGRAASGRPRRCGGSSHSRSRPSSSAAPRPATARRRDRNRRSS